MSPVELHSRELAALYEISRLLLSDLDVFEAIRRSLEVLATFLNLKRGTLTLIPEDGRELAIIAAYGLTPEQMRRGRYAPGEGITGQVLKSGQAAVVPDIRTEPQFLDKTGSRAGEKEDISFICVPVKSGSRTVGALSVDIDRRPAMPLDSYRDFLTIVAALMGQGVTVYRLRKAERDVLLEENRRLREQIDVHQPAHTIIGTSAAVQEALAAARQLAPSSATVMIRGESGTGKELMAQYIHRLSPRADHPLVTLNCSAIPESLLESELFGHERGSFTGAVARRIGRFEQADGGTLFLDEIGDLPPPVQVKLLRVLQTQEFERLGGRESIRVDVRIVSATHRDIEEEVAAGRFRRDLYYRLSVIPLFLPPLRQRPDDIPLLIDHFLRRFNLENRRHVRLRPGAIDQLIIYSWPGNIRELENTIERLVVMAADEEIDRADLPLHLVRAAAEVFPASPAGGRLPAAPLPDTGMADIRRRAADEERRRIYDALLRAGGNRRQAAKLLGMTPRQLYYRVAKYFPDRVPGAAGVNGDIDGVDNAGMAGVPQKSGGGETGGSGA
ncbi:MAG: nif-specific transcriptional activator NifA [Deltaproteobacteria bacterium]|nr:nif-specific transcriptional activator NifA [Candidatus Anaeroferrophillacea bacterium]